MMHGPRPAHCTTGSGLLSDHRRDGGVQGCLRTLMLGATAASAGAAARRRASSVSCGCHPPQRRRGLISLTSTSWKQISGGKVCRKKEWSGSNTHVPEADAGATPDLPATNAIKPTRARPHRAKTEARVPIASCDPVAKLRSSNGPATMPARNPRKGMALNPRIPSADSAMDQRHGR